MCPWVCRTRLARSCRQSTPQVEALGTRPGGEGIDHHHRRHQEQGLPQAPTGDTPVEMAGGGARMLRASRGTWSRGRSGCAPQASNPSEARVRPSIQCRSRQPYPACPPTHPTSRGKNPQATNESARATRTNTPPPRVTKHTHPLHMDLHMDACKQQRPTHPREATITTPPSPQKRPTQRRPITNNKESRQQAPT